MMVEVRVVSTVEVVRGTVAADVGTPGWIVADVTTPKGGMES